MQPTEATQLIAIRFDEEPSICQRICAGKNSRIYAVTCASGNRYAVKCYFQPTAEGKSRREQEWSALTFMQRCGISSIPEPLATFPDVDVSVLSFLEGTSVTKPDQADIASAIHFFQQLQHARFHPEVTLIGRAADACFSLQELVTNIDRRVAKLAAVPANDESTKAMLEWLHGPFTKYMRKAVRIATANLPTDRLHTPLPQELRTLSPSDFGFHNAVRNSAGELFFLDFEYFGWDDPAKAIADFILHPHPAMHMQQANHALFYNAMCQLFAQDTGLVLRVDCLFPLYRVKWCTILLNEFIAAHLQRRQFVEEGRQNVAQIRHTQLQKAISLLRQGEEMGPLSDAYK